MKSRSWVPCGYGTGFPLKPCSNFLTDTQPASEPTFQGLPYPVLVSRLNLDLPKRELQKERESRQDIGQRRVGLHCQIGTVRSALLSRRCQVGTVRSALSDRHCQIGTVRSALSSQYCHMSMSTAIALARTCNT